MATFEHKLFHLVKKIRVGKRVKTTIDPPKAQILRDGTGEVGKDNYFLHPQFLSAPHHKFIILETSLVEY